MDFPVNVRITSLKSSRDARRSDKPSTPLPCSAKPPEAVIASEAVQPRKRVCPEAAKFPQSPVKFVGFKPQFIAYLHMDLHNCFCLSHPVAGSMDGGGEALR